MFGVVFFRSANLLPRSSLKFVPSVGRINNFTSLVTSTTQERRNTSAISLSTGFGNVLVRNMNRNARRPKKANHGKRPCSHVRRREKLKQFSSTRFKKPIFGFFT